jgi:hypothetical protein
MGLVNVPHYEVVNHSLKSNMYFRDKDSLMFEGLPNVLIVEDSVKEFLIRQMASMVIRGTEVRKGHKRFFSGLRKTAFKGLYTGDHYCALTKKSSLLILDFSENNKSLKIYYFLHFKKNPNTLKTFIADTFMNKIYEGFPNKKGGTAIPPSC